LVVAAPLSAADTPSPSLYVGMEKWRLPAVSPEREKGLLEGSGIGLAKVAELNGQAGPRHVLDLGGQLSLTDAQRVAAQASFDRMHAEAIALGQQILAAEEELNRRFVHRHIDETTLADLTRRIAELEGRLRFVHLRAHLETDALLTDAQRQRYVELRGYRCCGEGDAAPADQHHHPG
jgi:Spy/CpxP family protein refolding chaperone